MNTLVSIRAPLRPWPLLPLVLVVLAAPLEGQAPRTITYSTYVNVRFRYTVAYPKNVLFSQGEADNGDGQRFLSAHADAVLTVYGRYNVLNESLSHLCAETARGRAVTYHVLKKNWFVVSGHANGRIFYCKTLRDKDVLRCVEFVYPERQKSFYDPIAARMAKSFRVLP